MPVLHCHVTETTVRVRDPGTEMLKPGLKFD